jgi:hypothetical protein
MKKIVLGAVFAAFATTAMAGSLAGPVVEEDIIVQQAATSSVNHHIIPPAMFVISVALGMLLL